MLAVLKALKWYIIHAAFIPANAENAISTITFKNIFIFNPLDRGAASNKEFSWALLRINDATASRLPCQ
jgi:hypothetical protein